MSEILLNDRIRARNIRLIDGEKTVVLSFHEALLKARKQNLDLVMVAAGEIPVCRIIDGDRFRYEKKKQEREQARKQRELAVETKELQLRPVTDDNDLITKARKAKTFLSDGDKVKVVVKFKGRERTHKDRGRNMIAKMLAEIGEHKVDSALRETDGDMMIILAPLVSKAELIRKKENDLQEIVAKSD